MCYVICMHLYFSLVVPKLRNKFKKICALGDTCRLDVFKQYSCEHIFFSEVSFIFIFFLKAAVFIFVD